jgi:type I restriction enzyme, S subunit
MSSATPSDYIRPLAKLAKVLLGQSPDSRTYNEHGEGWPFLQGNAEFGDSFPTHRLYCTAPNRVCEEGDILLSVRAPVGATNLADRVYAIGRGLAAIRFAREDQRFGWHALRYAVPQLELLAQGSTFTAVGRKEIEELSLWFPDGDERQIIATILDTLESVIEKADTLLAKQQRIKTGLVYDLLTRGLDAQGQLRPSVEMRNDLYWKSPVGWIPNDWTCDVLDKCASRITVGLATSVTQYYRDSGTRMIRNLNIRRGYFEGNDMVFLDPDFASRFPNKLVQKSDVLTCRTGSNVGDTCLVPAEYSGSHTFTTLITTTIRAKLVPEYLVDYMASEIGVRELGNILVGAGKENLNARQLAFLRVRLPSPPEQEQIHLRIKAAENSVNRLSQARAKLIGIKSGAMYDLLTGLVPVAALLSKSSI